MAGDSYYDGGATVDVAFGPTPDGYFPPIPEAESLSGGSIQTIAGGDLNGDGFADLFVFRRDGGWEAWVNTCGQGPR